MADYTDLFDAEASAHEKKQIHAQVIATGQGKGRPAMETPTFNVTIRLTAEEHRKLKLRAVDQNISVSAIIREWVKEKL